MIVYRDQLQSSICRDSFYEFFMALWPSISTEKMVDNWHIKFLCDELQIVMERVIKREKKLYDLVINIPPGTTKSSICSVALPAWCWTRDPSLRSICGSFKGDLTMDLASRFRRLVLSDKYKLLFPEVVVTSEGKEQIETDKGGFRLGTSVGTTPMGMHAHVHLLDDLIDAKKALSEASIKDAREWVMQTMPSRMVNLAITPTILLMQRVAIGDPTDVIVERAKSGGTPVRHICLPADTVTEDNYERVRPRSLRKSYVSGYLDPVRLPSEILATKRAELGQYAYAGQYDQRPVPAGGGMFRCDEIRVIAEAPGFMQLVRAWDKAGTEKGGAYTVGVLMGRKKDGKFYRYFVVDVVRGQWEASARERVIKQTAMRDGKSVPIRIETEPGSGGKESAQATVRMLAGWRVKAVRPVGNKVARADAFATQVNDGNVTMVKGAWNSEYLAELRLFWFGPFKDQVDSSSLAFSALSNILRVGAF